jgi:hypothetical protein
MAVGCGGVLRHWLRQRSLRKREANRISKEDVRVRLASARQLAIILRPTGAWRPGEIRPGQGAGYSNQ